MGVKVRDALRVWRCWKCKREEILTPDEHAEQRYRWWDCECGGSLHFFRLQEVERDA